MAEAQAALQALDFGRVDSESEPDLAARFLRTSDFDRFLDPRNTLILGAKGSGKSALFEMFTKYGPHARALAGHRMDGVLIATATGFGDVSELSTADIQSLAGLGEFQYEALWRVYIALKVAIALGQQGYSSTGPLRDFLRAAGRLTDYRLFPMLSSLWELVGGNAPGEISVTVMGTGVRIASGRATMDVIDLLEDIQQVLVSNNQRVWLLFDKIDELFPTDPDARQRALEGLFPAVMAISRAFPNIVARIFIRSDIYGPALNFTNKSHLSDKQFEIRWDKDHLRTLLVKRAAAKAPVRDWMNEVVPATSGAAVEDLDEETLLKAFYVVFDQRAYPGRREAELLDWMIARATDGKGSTYPREMITFGNTARENQLAKGAPGDSALLTGRSVVDAYYRVSEIRCQTFLSEFPRLGQHFRRFRGQPDTSYSRATLQGLFDGLDPSGDQAIEMLYDVGVLSPVGGRDVSVAESFEVPRLYKAGLGIRIIARP